MLRTADSPWVSLICAAPSAGRHLTCHSCLFCPRQPCTDMYISRTLFSAPRPMRCYSGGVCYVGWAQRLEKCDTRAEHGADEARALPLII